METVEASLKVLLTQAEEKRAVAESLAQRIAEEKVRLEAERQQVAEDTKICEEIQAMVTAQQIETEGDLARAEPAVEAAMQGTHASCCCVLHEWDGTTRCTLV